MRVLAKRPPITAAAPVPAEERWDVIEIFSFTERAALERWVSDDEVRETLSKLIQTTSERCAMSRSPRVDLIAPITCPARLQDTLKQQHSHVTASLLESKSTN